MSISWHRWRAFAVVAAGALLLGGTHGPAQAPNSAAVGLDSWRSVRLAIELKRAISQQNFKDLLDTAPPGARRAARLATDGDSGLRADPRPDAAEGRHARGTGGNRGTDHQTPNVDATVIELATDGHALSAADVLAEPAVPERKIVPHWTETCPQARSGGDFWDDTEWDANGGQGTTDVTTTENQNAPMTFMSPYRRRC